jgi:hypothetical protein
MTLAFLTGITNRVFIQLRNKRKLKMPKDLLNNGLRRMTKTVVPP